MIKLFFAILNEIGTHYHLKLAGLLVASVFAGLLELTGVALIFPLIALVNDISIVETNPYLNAVYRLLHFTDPKHMVYLVAFAIGVVFILKNLYMILFQRTQLAFIKKWRDELCERIMNAYLRTPYLFHLRRSSGDMINILNYTAYYVLNTFVMSTLMLCSNIIVSVLLLGFVMANFPIPTLIASIILAGFTAFQVILVKRSSAKIAEEANKPRAHNLAVITQSLGAIKETKSFTREAYFKDMHAHANRRVSEFDRRAIFLQVIPMYLTEIILVLTVIAMALLILSNIYSPVEGMTNLAVLAAVAFRLAPMVNRSLFAYSQVRVSSTAAREFLSELQLLDRQEIENFSGEITPLAFKKELRLANVDFHYKANVPALTNINLKIKKGQFIGIVGASGAGKTTLVDILLGLLRPTSGTYAVDGTAIKTTRAMRSLRSMIGYVSQNPCLFNATLRENVAFGIASEDIDDAKVTAALKMAQIDTFFATRRGYLHTMVNDQGKNLSGGQRQRIAIARALYANPPILILDEATSALDVETEHEITQVIHSLKGEHTIIAIAHRLSTLRECDRIVFMDGGRIVDVGTFTELKQRHKNFSRLLALSAVQ